MKGRFELPLVIVLLMPLLWIYTPNGHDWGGDFAAYIDQAENLIKGMPGGETGYVYNPEYYRLAPPTYPPGFPLMLAPCIAFFGNAISTLVIYMSVWMIGFGLLLYRFFRFHFNWPTATVAVLLIVYNPWMLRFKAQVIADLPFAALVLGTVVFYKLSSKRPVYLLLTLVFGVLAILTKTHGIVLIIAFVLDSLVSYLKKDKAQGGKALGMAASIGIISFLWNKLLTRGAEHFDHFSRIASEEGGFLSSAWSNLSEYMDVYRAFFIKDMGALTFIGVITSWILLVAAGAGALRKWKAKNFEIEDWVFLGLMATLIFFPITNGFRYLLPAFAFFFLYSTLGLSWPILSKWRVAPVIPWLGLLLLGLQYSKGWGKIAVLPDVPEGPYRAYYQPLHKAVKDLNEPGSLFLAAKPRVFAYMDDVFAASVHPEATSLLQEESHGYEHTYYLHYGKATRKLYVISVRAIPHEAIDNYEDGPIVAQDLLQEPPRWVIREYQAH